MNTPTILSLHYLPCISWFHLFLKGNCMIDVHEHYIKQSYRNRAVILSANGPLSLTIPVNTSNHTPVVKVITENNFDWQQNHWESLESAYNSSPYFEHYKEYFLPIYSTPPTSLASFNLDLIKCCLKILKSDMFLEISTEYITTGIDLRTLIHPKKTTYWTSQKYLQVFSEKFPFTPDLSIVDLLFNCGPEANEILK